jgi:hypothetical protein
MSMKDRAPCPDIGAWRAWLDREVHLESSEDHQSGCPACQRLVADLRQDASDVGDILSVLAPARLPNAAEVAIARERLEWRRTRAPQPAKPTHARPPEPIPMFLNRLSTPWRFAASGAAAALVIALLIAFTPEGGAVAASILSQFRSQQVTAIEMTPQTQAEITKTLNALGNLGTVEAPGASGGTLKPQGAARSAEEHTQLVTQAEAAQTVGFPLLTPDPAKLPAGVDHTPQVRVMPGMQIHFTFNKAKASAYFQSTGHPEVSLPDKFDGATLTVSIPSAAILEYGDKQSRQGLVVAEAGEVVADVQGKVSLLELRDFLIGLPGMPTSVANQLKQIQNWSDTLPIPIPVDQVHWESATINGSQGLLLNDNSGVGSAAIWHTRGHLYGVAGSIKATELKQFADSLAIR